MHPRLTHRAAWLDHDGALPVIDGTLIRLQVEHLPGERDPKPVWLWCSATGALPADMDRCWHAFLRRFDLEHTFRFLKQVLGWTAPKIRRPNSRRPVDLADHRAHTQLRLARPLAEDLRLPWERPAPPKAHARPRPPRVPPHPREDALPGSRATTDTPGPGRPPGAKNRRSATRYDVGEDHQKRKRTLKARARTRRLNGKLRAVFRKSGSPCSTRWCRRAGRLTEAYQSRVSSRGADC